jgi:hypothetical protein
VRGNDGIIKISRSEKERISQRKNEDDKTAGKDEIR